MLKLRYFQIGDERQVKSLVDQLTDDSGGFNGSAVAEDSNCKAIVADNRGQVIGFGCLIVHLVPTKGYVGRFEDIIVDKIWRGKGIGGMLIDRLIVEARNHNLKYIDLTSNPTRAAARKLYESRSFAIRNTAIFRLSL